MGAESSSLHAGASESRRVSAVSHGSIMNHALDGSGLRRVRVHAAGLGEDLGCGGDGLPSGQALNNALGILDRVNMPVVILDHLRGRTHLLRQKIDVDPTAGSWHRCAGNCT